MTFKREYGLAGFLFLLACGSTDGSSRVNDSGVDPVDEAVSDAPSDGHDSASSDGIDVRPIYRSHEGQYCSSSASDDPLYVCVTSSELVCINTFDKSYPNIDGGPDKVVAVYTCRNGCLPGDGTCASGEICCPGPIFGPSYGKSHGCVMREFCDHPPRDAGAGD
jgi:hypothetical protein